MISRIFNSVNIVGNEVVKMSSEKAKIINEYKHYYAMNDNMKKHLVKPYHLRHIDRNVSYTMKRQSNEDAGRLYAEGKLTKEDFSKILSSITDFRKSARSFSLPREESLPTTLEHTLDKARDRAIMLYSLSYEEFDNVLRSSLLSRLEKAIANLDERKLVTTMESHGDLCLSNILLCFDGEARFIDPRGADSIWLDSYYDIAKLSQSVLGGYDFIVNDVNESHNKDIQNMFLSYIEELGMSYNLIRAYEASLFISMCPLHIDRHDHIEEFLKKADQILLELGY